MIFLLIKMKLFMTLKELWIHTKFQLRNHWKLWVALLAATAVGLIVTFFPPALVFFLSIIPVISPALAPIAATGIALASFAAFNALCWVPRATFRAITEGNLAKERDQNNFPFLEE